MTRCVECFASPKAEDWVQHQRRFHIPNFSRPSTEPWACRDCRFRNITFPDALTHCLLAGHWLLPRSVHIHLTEGSNEQSKTKTFFHSPTTTDDKVKYRKTPIKPIDQKSRQVYEAEYLHAIKNETADTTKIAEEPKAGNSSTGSQNLIQRIITMRRGDDKQRTSMGTVYTPRKSEEAIRPAISMELDNDIQVTEESGQKFASSDCKDQTALLCHRCNESLTFTNKNRSAKMIRHILNCLGLQPNTCSACLYKTSIRHNVLRHMSSCPSSESARLTIAEKGATENAVFEGIAECFPGHTIAWRGLNE